MHDPGDENDFDRKRKRGLVGESVRVTDEQLKKSVERMMDSALVVMPRPPHSYRAHYRSFSRRQFVTRIVHGYDSFADTVELAANLSPVGMVLCGLVEEGANA